MNIDRQWTSSTPSPLSTRSVVARARHLHLPRRTLLSLGPRINSFHHQATPDVAHECLVTEPKISAQDIEQFALYIPKRPMHPAHPSVYLPNSTAPLPCPARSLVVRHKNSRVSTIHHLLLRNLRRRLLADAFCHMRLAVSALAAALLFLRI